jgi:gliding motility-associated-like protein
MTSAYRNNFLKVFLSFIFVLGTKFGYAQPCTGTISTFPYNEGFEANNGNWNTGGTASDWAWGTPAKTVITGAGGGNRSWITGGLAGSSYNNGENSWLQSPCFDLSALQYPQISFKVFWETERQFDGASFQYSTNGGTTWAILGTINSNTNCQGENWFNTPGVNFLSGASGWSGNIQTGSGSCLGGNGSGQWLTAKHTLAALAGQSNVRFRFLFGAGTTCNAFNGFAIDDIQIGEAPANTASFVYACVNDKLLDFSGPAPCASSYAWNFGDPASGANNTATGANNTHTFSGPGTYTVTLVTTFATGAPVTTTKEVVIIALTSATNWPGRCTGAADASLSVTPTGSNTPYFYNWNTSPAQTTQTVPGLGPGSYTVIVSSLNACSVSSNFLLAAPTPINILPVVTNVSCASGKGSITPNVTGGVAPYQYLWSNGATTASLSNLDAGAYSLQVTDVNNCSKNSGNIQVISIPGGLPVSLGLDRNLCTGQSITLNPGTYSNYLWQDNSTNATYTVTSAGTYFVTVTNATGCSGRDTVVVKTDCSGVYFPTSFTPNGDSRNDGFGPLGNTNALSNYTFSVYNRYGQRIFSSNNPTEKWDGSFKGGKFNTGTFVWMAAFELNGLPGSRKGTVTLIR